MGKIQKKHRIIVLLSALLLTVTLVLATNPHLLPASLWIQYNVPKKPINLTAVPQGTINKQIQIVRTGSIDSATSVPINAEFSGHLSEIYVTEGQVVKAGQPLLKLQASSESTVPQTTGASQQIQANYDKALEEFNRYQKLFEIGGIPRRQLDLAATHLQEAKENLNNAKGTMQSSSTTINGTATINAPINGIVTGLSTAPGKTVQAGQQLIALGTGQEVEAVVHLDQNDLYLAHLGTPATIEVSQQTVMGQISSIYPQVEANQISAFLAHIKLTNNPA
ncbi:MAG: efflux transporter, family, subunit, partial [Sporomusa sp.]|nr:efflux transporter, family, subunit [Sporomusa sp.]